MNRRLIGQLIAATAGVVAQAVVGWWALAVVAFVSGVALRKVRWVSVKYGASIAAAGVLMLAWVAWTGHPIGEVRRILVEITGAPALSLSLLLPALVALCAAFLGAAAGRKVLFG